VEKVNSPSDKFRKAQIFNKGAILVDWPERSLSEGIERGFEK
jgi:hypothetical protein